MVRNDIDCFENFKVGDYVELIKGKQTDSSLRIKSIFVEEGKLYIQVDNGVWYRPDEVTNDEG